MKNLKKNKYSFLLSIAKYSFVALFAVSLVTSTVFADPVVGGSSGGGGSVVGGSNTITSGIENPLGSNIKDLPTFIEAILNIVLVIGVPIVTLAIIYSGFLFVKARGNEEELTKAKKTFIATLIGAALLLGAFVIANAIKGTVDEIKRTT